MSYKIIYCAVIKDDKHEGLIKIGDTDFQPTKPLTSFNANDPELVKVAEKRIAEWSGTAAAGAECIYCDILLRYNPLTQNYETFRDHAIHTLVQSVGGFKVDFDSKLDSGREWFKTDLETVVAAIKAAKEGRDYLDTSEIPEKTIYTLREEQQQAVDKTFKRFEKAGDMLWHAKMRFGKTITALNLVKKEGYKHTIIITHRPVVEDSWGSDFYHVFTADDKYAFLTKIHDNSQSFSDDETDEAIDRANEERLKRLLEKDVSIVYFASIQDLRGSKVVGGKFEKNKIVFDTDWDLVIIDEAHEGTKTELGQAVINALVKEGTRQLDLSGTAYNLLDKYSDDKSVFTWDYVMEQERKAHWSEKHPGEPNPYADMPVMHINTFSLENAMHEKGFSLADKSFSFREFFRTWTGDLSKDRAPIPKGAQIGDFVHADHVKAFLDLLSVDNTKSRFPYATQEGCNENIHTLWMVPGVKEAAALSKMLKTHSFFRNFGIANVAGEGDHDEEKNFSNALEYVRKKIEKNPCTITLSCGRLTTGVTVKEWTSVFMLAGSDDTDAKQYMQTIFRVQSAGKVNGVQKTDCYVYDFAPDRALTVVAETAGTRSGGRGGAIIRDDEQHAAFEEFLGYCPVVAIDGAEFKPFNVQDLVSQINRVHIGRALRTGFMDNCIYDTSKFKSLTTDDLNKLNGIFDKLKETKKKGPLTKAGLTKSGLGKGKKGKEGKSSGKDKLDKKKQEDDQKKFEKELLERLRTVSIRIPLLFYGGEFEIEEGRLAEIVTGIDEASWKVFMPEKLTKKDFGELVQYYNQETVIGAGRAIREKARSADQLPPTERTIAIAEIFSHFQNPSHETVLTPWRIVNMHMAVTLGGYCFFNDKFEESDDEYYKRLQEPRFVSVDDVTEQTLANPDVHILEINSKSGLYPLYVTYSLYRAKLKSMGKIEAECLPEELVKVWDEAASQVYVICQSPMSVLITKRTLCGYRECSLHLVSEGKLVETLRTKQEKFTKSVLKMNYWEKGAAGNMRFEAVVGNPPYEEEGKNTRKPPIYHLFYDASFSLSDIVSLITPARFLFDAGQTPSAWNKKMLSDEHFKVVRFFEDSKEVFPTVVIKGGVAITFRDSNKVFGPIGTFTAHDELSGIIEAVKTVNGMLPNLDSIVSSRGCYRTTEKFAKDFPFAASRLGKGTGNMIASNFFEVLPEVYGDKQPDDPEKYYGFLARIDNKRTICYIKKEYIQKNDFIPYYNVAFPKSNGSGAFGEALSATEIIKPNCGATDTFINIGCLSSIEEAENLQKYIKTKFLRTMLGVKKATQDNPKSVWDMIPLQDFTSKSDIDWSQPVADIDEQLYKKYRLSESEINFIETMVEEMR